MLSKRVNFKRSFFHNLFEANNRSKLNLNSCRIVGNECFHELSKFGYL
jgi:hypothetical protein